jgi:zinc transporter, ZIP family
MLSSMSFAETTLLGAIAGLTIFLGLPLGRMRGIDTKTRVALAMFSLGILAFIFMDVASHGQAIIGEALDAYKSHKGGLGHVVGLFALLVVGFTAGVAGIATLERRFRPKQVPPPIAGAEQGVAVAPAALGALRQDASQARRRALQTGMTIAGAIGLHNFAEGLAIGVSAKSGAIGLATVLIIGFSLHNATEGFGIVGPLGSVVPSWRWLALAGLIGGGPTFLGTIIGYQVHSNPLELTFYSLAAGAILYVIGEIWSGMRRHGYRELGLCFIALGFLVGVATDLLVTYAGA